VGVGAMISAATDAKNFDLLLASTIALAAVVVTTNRLVWRRLYRLAETRFKLEDRQPTGCWKIHRGFAPVRPIGPRPPLLNPPAC